MMKNPNYPERKIHHAELLTKAGFKLDMGWMNLEKQNPSVKIGGVGKLIYWVNDRGIKVIFFDYQRVTLKDLVNKIISNTQYQVKKKAHTVFEKDL